MDVSGTSGPTSRPGRGDGPLSVPETSGRRGACRGHGLPGGALPLGECRLRNRSDPSPVVVVQRGTLRAAHHRRRGVGPMAVLPGDRRQGLAGAVRLAGAVTGRHVLGVEGDPGRGRQLSHRRGDRTRRGEHRRRRRGVYECGGQDDPGRRQRGGPDRGNRRAVGLGPGGLDSRRSGGHRHRHRSRVLGLRRRAGETG